MEIGPDVLERIFPPSVYRLILSHPVPGKASYRRITVKKLKHKYHFEQYTDTQVFHRNLPYEEAREAVRACLGSAYLQCNAWDEQNEYEARISKKGKLTVAAKPAKAPPKPQETQNRQKNHLLPEGAPVPPLVDMGVFTAAGKVVNSMYDKYRQINRLLEMIDDGVESLGGDSVNVVDFGCGKSYLTFVVYHYLTEIRKKKVRMVGLDLKRDVIEHCSECARKYGYGGLTFEMGDIAGYRCDFPVDIVMTLHACDTATDYALYQAVQWTAKLIYSVPCCQHEANAQMKSDGLSLLTRYGIVKERAAALLTDAIRANLLTYCGYETQLLEFIEMEHTPKNILIRARKANLSVQARDAALAEVRRAMEEFHLDPTLYRLLHSTN